MDKKRKNKFVKLLIDWEVSNPREFYWRNNRTAYKVFIAEILLKRTTSTAANRLFSEFLEKFPDLWSLARADIKEIKEIIKPLGLYNQRSVGIKEASLFLLEVYKGEFPKKFDKLLEIPHIGPYSAACILSFGFGIPAPAIDSNGIRVLTRVFKDVLGKKPKISQITALAWELIPDEKHELFNYGLIDLGRTVCTYRQCNSPLCPIRDICSYHLNSST